MKAIVQTPELIIRLFEAEEETFYLSLFDDEKVMQYLPYRSKEELITVFRNHLNEIPDCITGRWGIYNPVNNDFMGMCLLRLFDDGSESIELGYVLHPNYWGKGIATQMAAAMLKWAAAIKPGTTFVAVTNHDNIASQRVLEKAGMQRDGNYIRQGHELAFFKI